MVGAFDTLRVAEGVARPDQLAGDISVALITTVLGLIVAIPATAAYAFLRARVDSLASDVGVIVDALASKAESQSSRRQAAAPAPVAAPPRTAEARA
ncbi:MAG: MotA/TolQ/ExbB proton channel family protein, partial [Planctomycetota bacterium]